MTLRGGVLRETTPSSMSLPDLNTIPYDCVGENSRQLSGSVIGLSCTRSLVRILAGPYINAMLSFICFFVEDFARK